MDIAGIYRLYITDDVLRRYINLDSSWAVIPQVVYCRNLGRHNGDLEVMQLMLRTTAINAMLLPHEEQIAPRSWQESELLFVKTDL